MCLQLPIQGAKAISGKRFKVDIYCIYISSKDSKDTSEESSDNQLLGAGKSEGLALLRGHHTYLLQKAHFVNFLQLCGGFLTFCLL